EKVKKGKMSPDEKTELKLNVVGKIPEILLDNTDRNRTSPFAFTGNKFEFRAVGSSANCAEPMMVLNTIVAHQLKKFKSEVDGLIEKGLKKDEAIFNVLRDYIKTSRNILFEGDGYSKDWEKEAAKRKLRNLKTTPEALKIEREQKFKDIFLDNAVLSEIEIEARNEIKLEKYSTLIDIEAQVLADLARNHIIPTAVNYQNKLIENVKGLKDIFSAEEFKSLAQEQIDLIKMISGKIAGIKVSVDRTISEMKKCQKILDTHKKA